jgi:succinyl-diaminopimelate desuccinylase
MNTYEQLDAWIDAHFDEQVRFLQELIRVPTDTPPGNNAPHAERTAELLRGFGFDTEKHAVPEAEVRAAGLESITNLVVRRKYGPGTTVLLNAHGDVVPPGEGWTKNPYGGEIADGKIYGRAAAVSKCDFSTYAFAVRALEAVAKPAQGSVELLFTYDEEFGGEVGPAWLLKHNIIKPDLMVAAGFSYQVITAHNGCLQMEVTVHGKMAHAAIPSTGVDALHAANRILTKLYEQNTVYQSVTSKVEGITHPYLNIGTIEGGTNTNVVPGRVSFKLDRRIGNRPLVDAIQKHGEQVFGEPIPALGTPLYTDVRLFCEAGIPGVIYGAGPRTVLESHAKRADERLDLEDLRRATKVVARTLLDLLAL